MPHLAEICKSLYFCATAYLLNPRLVQMVQPSLNLISVVKGFAVGFLFLVISSCSDDCSTFLPEPTCAEKAPTDELCQAYFQRWFFDASSQQCQQIGYSGCGEYGFATQAECEGCKCSE